MTLAPVFRARLAQIIEQRPQSQPIKCICDQSGYSEQYIRRIMRGDQSNPSLMFVEAMAETLGVSVAWLLGFEGTTDETLQDII